jgi:lipopolysaccharide export system permease protein
MKLIERYIFARLSRVFVLSLTALCATVWLTQAIGQVTLMTTQGQVFSIFLKISLLLLPEVASLITPVAVLIAVTYTFTTLNNDSELVVINASGAPQLNLLRPVFAIGLVAAALIALMTLYLAPVAQRQWRFDITAVRASVVTSILREGAFIKIADGLVFNLRNRRTDGTLHGIFVSDTRDPASTVTYLAEDGTVVDSAVGTFLIMKNGTIQRRSTIDGTMSMIEFGSYAFDLTTFASETEAPSYRPGEQSTLYLLRPDAADPFFQRMPGQFAIELNRRLVSPLYALVCAMIPLVFLVQAESTRRRRTLAVAAGVAIAVAVRILGAFLNATSDTLSGASLSYAIPLGAILIAAVLILTGTRPRIPDGVTDRIDDFFERIRGMFARPVRADDRGW